MFQNIIVLIESYPSVIDGKTPSLPRRTQLYSYSSKSAGSKEVEAALHASSFWG